ncbi:thiol-disulfide oxidoreductase DCC family protein [Paenibacillus daejeonensis]|uniref:thiol-disulfide oxidoreductase DCC family protein n=1 Tax=Paenibacillus daejeonensis TaxID=135193 RepID=UPI000366A74F|nr:thiol-disulfide oxidoreductase DCC family protein [Paenibacillus daejeonensis]
MRNSRSESGKQEQILLFDGVCGLCTRSVRFVLKRDQRRQFQFAPLQSPVGQRIVDAHQAAGADSFMLLQNGELYMKSEAALRVGRQLGGLWRLCGLLLFIPRGLRDAVYDWIASNRYRWFGKMDACMRPDPQDRDRFLED